MRDLVDLYARRQQAKALNDVSAMMAVYHRTGSTDLGCMKAGTLLDDKATGYYVSICEREPREGPHNEVFEISVGMGKAAYARVYLRAKSRLKRVLDPLLVRDRGTCPKTVLVHYIVALLYGLAVPIGFQIHHGDLRTLNNAIQNLWVVPVGPHNEFHNLIPRTVPHIWLAENGMRSLALDALSMPALPSVVTPFAFGTHFHRQDAFASPPMLNQEGKTIPNDIPEASRRLWLNVWFPSRQPQPEGGKDMNPGDAWIIGRLSNLVGRADLARHLAEIIRLVRLQAPHVQAQGFRRTDLEKWGLSQSPDSLRDHLRLLVQFGVLAREGHRYFLDHTGLEQESDPPPTDNFPAGTVPALVQGCHHG